ncbi:MAG: hypothetical protein ACX931_07335 [Saccharospirillum sp.]
MTDTTDRLIEHPNGTLTLSPEASLNRLPVTAYQMTQAARDWVGARALHELIVTHSPAPAPSVRQFLDDFQPGSIECERILAEYGNRLAAVLRTALRAEFWAKGSAWQQAYARYWQHARTLVLSGGISTGAFGHALAERLELDLGSVTVIASPWGGQTGLVGLAQHVSRAQDLLVLDFGATGIKRAVASRHGNRLDPMPDVAVKDWLDSDGLFRKPALLELLGQLRATLGQPLPVAISIAAYLDQGHPFDYRSGIYHRLRDDSPHLATSLDETWLPQCGLGPLALLEHDSTAAALAFRFAEPAIMVTLGTGLGVGLCPIAKPT